jgi:hypothetical protein
LQNKYTDCKGVKNNFNFWTNFSKINELIGLYIQKDSDNMIGIQREQKMLLDSTNPTLIPKNCHLLH